MDARTTLPALVPHLCSARIASSCVPPEQTLEALLADSANDQTEVTNQLGYQVRRAVEIIVQTIDRIDIDSGHELLSGVSEDETLRSGINRHDAAGLLDERRRPRSDADG